MKFSSSSFVKAGVRVAAAALLVLGISNAAFAANTWLPKYDSNVHVQIGPDVSADTRQSIENSTLSRRHRHLLGPVRPRSACHRHGHRQRHHRRRRPFRCSARAPDLGHVDQPRHALLARSDHPDDGRSRRSPQFGRRPCRRIHERPGHQSRLHEQPVTGPCAYRCSGLSGRLLQPGRGTPADYQRHQPDHRRPARSRDCAGAGHEHDRFD